MVLAEVDAPPRTACAVPLVQPANRHSPAVHSDDCACRAAEHLPAVIQHSQQHAGSAQQKLLDGVGRREKRRDIPSDVDSANSPRYIARKAFPLPSFKQSNKKHPHKAQTRRERDYYSQSSTLRRASEPTRDTQGRCSLRRARIVIRAYEQVVLCACAACCWCATMRLVSWMKLSRFADEKLFGCG